MDALHLYLIAMAVLVSVQIVMTRFYGWRGLASTTMVLVLLVLGGEVVLFAWLRGNLPPKELAELAVVFILFWPLTLYVPLFIVLLAFILLAVTKKTEPS